MLAPQQRLPESYRTEKSMASHTTEETGPSRPLNVEQIVKKAENFDYNPLIPLKYWLRSAGTLLKEVPVTAQKGWKPR